MKLLFPLLLVTGLLSFSAPAQSNLPESTNASAASLLQIQEQLHATRLAIEETRQAATNEARKNAEVLAARLQSLEQSVTAQRASEMEASRHTQQFTWIVLGVFGLIGLGGLVLMVFFQWRAFSQIAQISTQQQAALAQMNSMHQLAAPGRATVETSNARLLEVVDELQRKIERLESGHLLPPPAAIPTPAPAIAKVTDRLATSQKFLETNQPQQALEVLEPLLAGEPDHPGALTMKASALEKKAAALEKLGRTTEAVQCLEAALRVSEQRMRAGVLADSHQ